MSDTDPFDLPEGYGGVARTPPVPPETSPQPKPSPQPASAGPEQPRRKSIEELEAEVRAERGRAAGRAATPPASLLSPVAEPPRAATPPPPLKSFSAPPQPAKSQPQPAVAPPQQNSPLPRPAMAATLPSGAARSAADRPAQADPFAGLRATLSDLGRRFDPWHLARTGRFPDAGGGAPPAGTTTPAPPPADGGTEPPAAPPPTVWQRRWKWIRRGALAFSVLFMLTVAWLAWTAPLSKSLEPIVPPQITLVSADGRPFARNGAVVDDPVDVTKLPPHVIEAFLATEDRRFYSHWGIDPYGIARAMWTNVTTGTRQGGSTITQQLAKFTFLNSDQTYGRKAREALIALWMEGWLTKDDILSRYLSNAYFGDNVYGLRAASLHYFYRQPERLTLSQATMLAGLVKAPSRLAPTRNLRAARARQRVVIAGMVDAGFLTPAEARAVRPAEIDHRARGSLPSGTYFADWAMPEVRASVDPGYGEARVTTTLDMRLQRLAERVTAAAPRGAQVALVAMRPDGEVVAMVGGRDYAASPFNRATQARRQPGSAFKVAVYLAALRSGMTPDTLVDDSAITEGEYRPSNYGGRYRGEITLREAFARSSNVVAVRLYHQLGGEAVRAAARDLGITSPIADNASAALGTSDVTLLELTAAYATIAGDLGPVEPHGIAREEPGFIESLFDGKSSLPSAHRAALLDMLGAVINTGTGRAARLTIPAYGKTGTTQDSRDAVFVGFAGDLVVGVWIGKDDNSAMPGLTGGGVPARMWRDFMAGAVRGAAPARRPDPAPDKPDPVDAIFEELPVTDPEVRIDPDKGVTVNGRVGPLDITIDSDGVNVQPSGQGTAPSQ